MTIAAQRVGRLTGKPSGSRPCWRCGQEHDPGSRHLTPDAPCGDCREVLRAEGDATIWDTRTLRRAEGDQR